MRTDRRSTTLQGRGRLGHTLSPWIPYPLPGYPTPSLDTLPPPWIPYPLPGYPTPSLDTPQKGHGTTDTLTPERTRHHGYPTPSLDTRQKGHETRDTITLERTRHQGYPTPPPPPPCGQTNTSENISFPQLLWRSVK